MIRNSKILKIVLPLIGLLLCYAAYEYGYVALTSAKMELQDTREQKEKMLFKYVAAISKKQQISSTLHFLRPVKAADDEGIINEPVPATAMESLRNTLKEIIIQGGGQIAAERTAEPVKSGIYRIYEIEIDAMLPDTRALNDIVHGIETHTLFMTVKQLNVWVTNPDNPRELAIKLKINAIGIGK